LPADASSCSPRLPARWPLLSSAIVDSAGSECALLKPGGYTFKLKDAGLNTTRGGMLVNGVLVDKRSTVVAAVNGVTLQSASPHVGGYALVPPQPWR